MRYLILSAISFGTYILKSLTPVFTKPIRAFANSIPVALAALPLTVGLLRALPR